MIGSLEILNDEQADVVVKLVEKLEKVWIRREVEPIDFFTIGACTYMDGVADIERYHEHRKIMNPLLISHFNWLYDVVIDKFSQMLGPMRVVEELGHPGFHVFGHKPDQTSHPICVEAFQKPSASLHFDHQYEEHMNYWNTFDEVNFKEVLSFTLPVELPQTGGGLWLWNWTTLHEGALANFNFQDSHGEAIDFKTYMDDVDPRCDKDFWQNKTSPTLCEDDPIYDDKPIVLPYKVGRAAYHIGSIWHQIMPGYKLSDTDRRITLQGHGIKCDGIWRLYF